MIPYTIDRRADTGVTNVTMGIWLFIASEVMLFGALFSAYALLRTAATAWPSGRATLELPIGAVNTAVLVALTFTAWRARGGRVRARLSVATLLAMVFLALKSLEYAMELRRGVRPATSTFFAMYFTLTGLHALHVGAGAIANTWIAAASSRVQPAITSGRVQAATIYWTFVDVVWLLIFALFYLS